MNTCRTATIALFGLPVSSVSMAEAITAIEHRILDGVSHRIALANLASARHSLHDFSLQRLLCECSLVLADGVAMRMASSLFGGRWCRPLTALGLVQGLARLSAQRGYSICLVGSSAQTLKSAAVELSRRFPGARFTTCASEAHPAMDAIDDEDLLRQIEQANPVILLVALGSPSQEIWMQRHRSRLRVPVSIGIGDALATLAGESRPAPRWLERLHPGRLLAGSAQRIRLLRERTLAAAVLARHLLPVFAANRLQPRERSGRLTVQVYASIRVVETPASLTGGCCRWLAREARVAAAAGQTLIVDMSATRCVEADGLGGLLEASRILTEEDLWIWLAGMSSPLRRVLHFSALSHLFRIAATPHEAVQFTLASRVPPPRLLESGGNNWRERAATLSAAARAG